MSGNDDSGEEKSLPPSDKKLRDARKKGDFAKSVDAVSAAVVISLLLLFSFASDYFAARFNKLFIIAGDAAQSGVKLSGRAMEAVWGVTAEIVLPVFGVATAATFLGALIANRGLVVSTHPISPDMNKINPVQGFKKLFSLRNLIEFLKSMIKTAIFFGVCAFLVWVVLGLIMRTPLCEEGCVPLMIWRIVTPLFAAAALIFIVSALLDGPLQDWIFRREKRMTHTEMKRERKEQYGDPQVRGELKRVRREMLAGAGRPGSGVRFTIADGGHLAVTLSYDARGAGVPIVDAKHVGDRAALALEAASLARETIVNNPTLAHALNAEARLGKPPPKHFFDELARIMIRAGLLGG